MVRTTEKRAAEAKAGPWDKWGLLPWALETHPKPVSSPKNSLRGSLSPQSTAWPVGARGGRCDALTDSGSNAEPDGGFSQHVTGGDSPSFQETSTSFIDSYSFIHSIHLANIPKTRIWKISSWRVNKLKSVSTYPLPRAESSLLSSRNPATGTDVH